MKAQIEQHIKNILKTIHDMKKAKTSLPKHDSTFQINEDTEYRDTQFSLADISALLGQVGVLFNDSEKELISKTTEILLKKEKEIQALESKFKTYMMSVETYLETEINSVASLLKSDFPEKHLFKYTSILNKNFSKEDIDQIRTGLENIGVPFSESKRRFIFLAFDKSKKPFKDLLIKELGKDSELSLALSKYAQTSVIDPNVIELVELLRLDIDSE